MVNPLRKLHFETASQAYERGEKQILKKVIRFLGNKFSSKDETITWRKLKAELNKLGEKK